MKTLILSLYTIISDYENGVSEFATFLHKLAVLLTIPTNEYKEFLTLTTRYIVRDLILGRRCTQH